MRIRFWGTRGSIPSPGPGTVRYGGNTSCVEVDCGETLLILDAGTGIRLLGNELMAPGKGQPVTAHLLLSHFHWDHIQGFPFFAPAFVEGNRLKVYASQGTTGDNRDILAGQMRGDYFPVDFGQLPSRTDFSVLAEGELNIGDVRVLSKFVSHPGRALGYRIEWQGRSVCYVCDNEPDYYLAKSAEGNGAVVRGALEDVAQGRIRLGEKDRQLVEFIRDSDVLIHDSQYLVEEYVTKIGWGHSFNLFAVELALQAGVNRCVLFHHDPMREDDEIDQTAEACREHIRRSGASLECIPAAEGMVIELQAAPRPLKPQE